MPSAPNAAVRRFRMIRFVSVAVKVAALATLLVLIAVYFGGL